MIKRIILRNFQVHRKLVVDFDKYITTIIGPSDVGKSSILRALEWVCLNRPSGDEFIRTGARYVRVQIQVGKRTITRTKGSLGNHYYLDDKKFTAFGNTVPPEISKLLNVGDFNFQGQLDPHFWFSLTPGQVSKELNQIVNLEVIDFVLADLAAKNRKAKAAVEISQDKQKEVKQEQKKLIWVPGFDKELTELERQDHATEKNRLALLSLRGLVNVGRGLRVQKFRATDAATAASSLAKQAASLQQRDQTRRSLLESVKEAQEAKRAAAIKVPDITKLTQRAIEATETISLIVLLRDTIQDARSLNKTLIQSNLDIAEVENKLHKQFKGICPLCGQRII